MTCRPIQLIFLIRLVLLQFQWCDIVGSVLVKVEHGWLRGETKTVSTNLEKYHSFKGIPYAAPPLGKLRFLAPQPPLKWKGIRNATEHCSICMQPASLYKNITAIGNEDCICLNVYTPDLKPDCFLPVMFFIHGGIFVIGSGNSDQFGPDFFMSYNVVLVTVNYRLGAFGFIAIGTKEIPGNSALKDILAALQWVQSNIKSFGGDPARVTIFGQSAGAAIISSPTVASSASKLFKRAILMSGSPINDWTIAFDAKRRAFAQGRVLGMDTNNPYKLTRFLQSVPAKDLIEAHPNFLTSDQISNVAHYTTYYTPIIEEKSDNNNVQYLSTRPTALICNNQINQVDMMIGHTASEGSGTVADMEKEYLAYFSSYKELLVPLKIRFFRSIKEVLKLADIIEEFYFKNKAISRRTILDLIKFYSAAIFTVDIHAFVEKLYSLSFVHRYFYVFSLYSSRNIYAKPAEIYGIKEATHRDDLPYLFDGSSYNQTVDIKSEEFKYIQLMCKLYTNFAKYGTPTPDDSLGLIWPEYGPDKRYVNIGRNGTLTSEIIHRNSFDLKFWHDLYCRTGIDIY